MNNRASPVAQSKDGVRVTVRLTPKASSDRLGGVVIDAAGRPALKAWVSVAPEDGKANAALIKLLAKKCSVPPSTLSIVGGHAQRTKVVHIAGDAGELTRRIGELLGTEK